VATQIHFVPNDPLAGPDPPMRKKAPSPNRPSSRAGFNLAAGPAAGLYAPGTAGFIHWQCREAAIQAVKVWEGIAGPLTRWARSSNLRKLDLFPDFGLDLNAYYDGQSLSFFHSSAGTKTTFSGASTDVVSHEAGHGFLDAIRPDLWFSSLTETGAFHEAFGDCMAIVAALSDLATRRAVLQGNLAGSNFVEATAEDLSDGIRRDPRFGPAHPASQPRHAFNSFQWALPTTLPTSGGPNVLSSEVHSFARVFTGCFYDAIRNVFAALGAPSEARLLAATRTVARLLVAGARQAPEVPRFFQAVGRAMVLADQAAGGANHIALRDAFSGHGIDLGSNAMLMPRMSLAGGAPRLAGKGAALSRSTMEDLRERMQATGGAGLSLEVVKIGGQPVVQAVHRREVSLGAVSPRLKGVVARVAETVLVGKVQAGSGKAAARPAVVSALPDARASEDEVHVFVESLLKNDGVDLDGSRTRAKSAPRGAVAARHEATGRPLPTHAVRAEGGKKVLVRVRFL